MSQELVRRAEALRTRGKILQTIPGSGFHDSDRGSPQREGLSRAGEHLVPFWGEWDVVFAGDDAAKALAALQAHHVKLQGLDPIILTGTERKLLRAVPKQKLTKAEDGTDLLVLRLAEWNDFLEALYAQGAGLTGATLEPNGTPP